MVFVKKAVKLSLWNGKNPMNKITQKELKEYLHYNPATGIFKWKNSTCKKIKIEDVAGTKKVDDGYIRISINNKLYSAHRLAFLYMDSYIPEYDVDHIDQNKSNNKWENLRHVSRSCNRINSGLDKNNTSGIKGVYFHKKVNKWASCITINKKTHHLGTFKYFTKAVYHRWKAECKYGWPNCNSTSSAYLYLKNHKLIK